MVVGVTAWTATVACAGAEAMMSPSDVGAARGGDVGHGAGGDVGGGDEVSGVVVQVIDLGGGEADVGRAGDGAGGGIGDDDAR